MRTKYSLFFLVFALSKNVAIEDITLRGKHASIVSIRRTRFSFAHACMQISMMSLRGHAVAPLYVAEKEFF